MALLNATHQQQECINGVGLLFFVILVCGKEFGFWPASGLARNIDDSIEEHARRWTSAFFLESQTSLLSLQRFHFWVAARPFWGWRFLLDISHDSLFAFDMLLCNFWQRF